MNILIIDDHEIVVEGIKARIKKVFPDCKCTYAQNFRSAYADLSHNQFDIILCDLEFDDEDYNGFDLIKNLLNLEPKAKLIAHTHHYSYKIMKKAIETGFKAYLHKGCSFNDFQNTLINVLKNGRYESEAEKELKRKRLQISRTIFNDSIQAIIQLSNRELEVSIQTIETTDRYQLSEKLNIEPYTVDAHIKNILSKLGLSNRKELSIFAYDFKDLLEKELNDRK